MRDAGDDGREGEKGKERREERKKCICLDVRGKKDTGGERRLNKSR